MENNNSIVELENTFKTFGNVAFLISNNICSIIFITNRPFNEVHYGDDSALEQIPRDIEGKSNIHEIRKFTKLFMN